MDWARLTDGGHIIDDSLRWRTVFNLETKKLKVIIRNLRLVISQSESPHSRETLEMETETDPSV